MAVATKPRTNRKAVATGTVSAGKPAAANVKPGPTKLGRRIGNEVIKAFTKDKVLLDAWNLLAESERETMAIRFATIIDREVAKVYPAT